MRPANDTGRRGFRARWARNGGIAVAATLATIGATTTAVSAQPGGDHHPAFTKVDLSGHGAAGVHYTPAAVPAVWVPWPLQSSGLGSGWGTEPGVFAS